MPTNPIEAKRRRFQERPVLVENPRGRRRENGKQFAGAVLSVCSCSTSTHSLSRAIVETRRKVHQACRCHTWRCVIQGSWPHTLLVRCVPTVKPPPSEAPAPHGSRGRLHQLTTRAVWAVCPLCCAWTLLPPAELASFSSPPPPPELAMVARAVERLVARNDALLMLLSTGGGDDVNMSKGMAAFEAARGAAAPRIGVAEYMERVHRYAALDPECYVVAYVYIDRAAHRRPAAAVASRNVHRLLLACLLVAYKVLHDFHHSNAFFARVGGVSNAEMNKLELELLVMLDFEVAVGHRTYDSYRAHLEKEMLRYSGGVLMTAAKARLPTASSKMPSPVVAPLTAAAAVVAAAAAPRLLKPNGVPATPPTIRKLLAVDYY